MKILGYLNRSVGEQNGNGKKMSFKYLTRFQESVYANMKKQ